MKISIVGAGFVGASTAFALMQKGIATEICINDINKEKALGEAMDLSHGIPFVNEVNIYSGSIEDTKNSDIIIITAGAGQKPGETRLDLISKNYKIFKSFIPDLAKYSPNSILLVVANPVDILSYITYKLSGFPKERVIGSGTVLDTSRLKHEISHYFNVTSKNVHTNVLGEHGDSEFVAWNEATISNISIEEYAKINHLEWNDEVKAKIENNVRNSAYEVIKYKKATYYAVALAITRIVEAIVRDEKAILTVSSLMQGEYGINNIYISVPSLVGKQGLIKTLVTNMSEDELKKLKKSAKILSESCANLEK